MVKIKICGLFRECDIEAVNAAMPDYVGFIFTESHRRVSVAQALALRKKLHPAICPVGVFRNEAIEVIRGIVECGIIEMVQLHGDEDEDCITQVKTVTGKPVIKSVAVSRRGSVGKWKDTCADYLLLDNVSGGSGERFDWGFVGEVGKPFFLAGGINVENVQEAIERIRPFAVDVSSGVETDRVKDAEKIKAIVERVRIQIEGSSD